MVVGCTSIGVRVAQGITVSWAHQKFASVFHKTGDRRLAAKEAGSEAKDLYTAGSVLLARPGVRSELERLRGLTDDATVQSAADTKSEVLSLTRKAIKISEEGKPVIGKNGSAVREDDGSILRTPDTAGMLKGAELLGKTVAMFTDKHQHGDGLEDKSDHELALMIEAALVANPAVLDQVARIDAVCERVHAITRDESASEGAGGEAEEETLRLLPTPEAADTPGGGLH